MPRNLKVSYALPVGESVDCIRKVFITSVARSKHPLPSPLEEACFGEMRNFREALGIVKEEKEKALKELALIRKHNTHLVDSLDKSVDSIMLKDKQLKDLRFQLEQTRGALECAKMEAAVRQACSENRVKTLREEIEAQKADIEELRGSNEDLKSVVQKLSKEVRHQQDHIALRYIEPESAENHAMEALRKAIKESQEAKRGKYVSVARERSLNNLDGHSERHRISKERICAIVDVPTGLYHSLKTKLLPEGNCLSNKSISDKPSPAAVSTNSSRILRKGKVVEHTGFAYPKEHTVPDCIPERNGRHHFSGAGSNAHYAHFTCKHCHFRCRERKALA
uniref:Uncharacterized protein n=1 Tax=Psilocybe cubensis TaxID=181762 RepID=A0A8H8CEU0_PSICU